MASIAQHRTGRLTIWLTLAIGWVVLTHLPKLPPGPVRILHLDKIVHFTGFAVLSFVGLWANDRRRLDTKTITIWMVGFAVFAMADELTQPWFGRGTEFLDWVADITGACVAMVVWRTVFSTHKPTDTVG